MAKAFEFRAHENDYEGETEDGRKVRCNADDFSSIAEECEQAGIELTPERALAEGWPGFYVVAGRGGARPGAGRKAQGTTYAEGYQAGYKAGTRSRTIETAFDESVLPRWARNYPAVVERCKNHLAYRANVCSATTKQMRDLLKREVGIR